MSKKVFRLKLKKPSVKKSKSQLLHLALSAAGILVLLLTMLWVSADHEAKDVPVTIPELNKMDTKTLQKEVALLERKVHKLAEKRDLLYPRGSSILKGQQVVVQDKCSTGSGLELTDKNGGRSWTFETPRGYFRVLSKVSNPIWFRPDWAFIEEGESIPKSRDGRAVPDVLGKYAIAFGDGYFIHGTLYTRMLGSSVTHGCVRVDDDTLKKLYDSAPNGTPIWIY